MHTPLQLQDVEESLLPLTAAMESPLPLPSSAAFTPNNYAEEDAPMLNGRSAPELNAFEDLPYVIDDVCEKLQDRIDFENENVRESIFLMEMLETNAYEQQFSNDKTDPSSRSQKIVMYEGQINDLLLKDSTGQVRLLYGMWEELFHFPGKKLQQQANIRHDMNKFASNGMKPSWTPVFNNQ
jgi:hypothetical protein